jgi:ATP-binding cassette, subfamily B, bacterial PglK
MSYLDFIENSSSKLIHNILNESLHFTSFLYFLLIFFTEIMVISLIYIALFFMNWQITLSLSFVIIIGIIIIIKIVKPIIKDASQKRSECQSKLLATLNETFGNFKYIKLLDNKEHFKRRFFDAGTGFVRAEAIYNLYGVFPKITMETGGITILLIVLLYALFLYRDPSSVVVLLTMYAIAFFRLLPSANRIMVSLGHLIYYKNSVQTMVKEMAIKVDRSGRKIINFTKEIKLENISFYYDQNKIILEDINLLIPIGSKVAILGPSGCGKTTLIDIILGLLPPIEGAIKIDGISLDESNIFHWHKKIGYIPQSIYLFEGTVLENVVCGRKENKDKVIEALQKAKIYDFLLTKEGLDTNVGENGVMLSGGQKQRIGIARAFYGNPQILILDEATSALDKNIEQEIMKEIFEYGQNLTIIIITHREYFLENCDLLYRLNE